MTSLSISGDSTKVIGWMLWTDYMLLFFPIALMTFHPCFHRLKKTPEKQRILFLSSTHNHNSLRLGITADHNSLRFVRKVLDFPYTSFSPIGSAASLVRFRLTHCGQQLTKMHNKKRNVNTFNMRKVSKGQGSKTFRVSHYHSGIIDD